MDLGNVMADSNGNVDVTFQDKRAGLVGRYSIAGRAFVVSQTKFTCFVAKEIFQMD